MIVSWIILAAMGLMSAIAIINDKKPCPYDLLGYKCHGKTCECLAEKSA